MKYFFKYQAITTVGNLEKHGVNCNKSYLFENTIEI